MGTVLDLDARRAEHGGKPVQVRLDGTVWNLPNPMPAAVKQDLAQGNVRSVIALLFAADARAEALAKHPADHDRAQAEADRAVAGVVVRLLPFLDEDSLELLLAKGYDIGTSTNRAKAKAEKGDPPAPS